MSPRTWGFKVSGVSGSRWAGVEILAPGVVKSKGSHGLSFGSVAFKLEGSGSFQCSSSLGVSPDPRLMRCRALNHK